MDEAEKIKIIAEHYGYDSQSRQCIEEMAELTQAINKWWRVCGNGQRTARGGKTGFSRRDRRGGRSVDETYRQIR